MIYTRVIVVKGSNILEILQVELIGFANGFLMQCEPNGVSERKNLSQNPQPDLGQDPDSSPFVLFLHSFQGCLQRIRKTDTCA